eukprot:jgi/Astpho2/7811/fgenesh1_pg.00117_%23_27_t
MSYYAVLSVPKDAPDNLISQAYRRLAQTYHPDKCVEESSKEKAQEHFTRVQEAYEVLSDPVKRQIYDVYGKQGLTSGLELGERLRTADDIKAEMASLEKQKKAAQLEGAVDARTVVVAKLDATDTMAGILEAADRSAAKLLPHSHADAKPAATGLTDLHVPSPEVTALAITHNAATELTDGLAGFLGGQVVVQMAGNRATGGGGAFVFGLRRADSSWSNSSLEATAGMRSLLSFSNTRALSLNSSATISGSYSFGTGLGLQVGASTGIVARAVVKINPSASLRFNMRAGTAGIEAEVGVLARFSEFNTGSLSVATGLQGVSLKASFTRTSHRFDFPILLSRQLDARTVAAAYLLPPVVGLTLQFCVWRPLRRRWNSHQALKARSERGAEIAASLRRAENAQQLMVPVAARRTRAEASKDGLLILSAKFGTKEAIAGAELAEQRHRRGGPSTSGSASADGAPQQPASPVQRRTKDATADPEVVDEDANAEGHAAASPAPNGTPPAWLDVTVPLRFMVEHSKLKFYQDVPKAGLMGFADVAPDAAKVLVVHFTHEKQAFMVTLDEQAAD